jgi:hypothetical protein
LRQRRGMIDFVSSCQMWVCKRSHVASFATRLLSILDTQRISPTSIDCTLNTSRPRALTRHVKEPTKKETEKHVLILTLVSNRESGVRNKESYWPQTRGPLGLDASPMYSVWYSQYQHQAFHVQRSTYCKPECFEHTVCAKPAGGTQPVSLH